MSTYFITSDMPLSPRLRRVVSSSLACLSDAARQYPAYLRHAVWERLAVPAAGGAFPLVWMGDDGNVRVCSGYYAAEAGARGVRVLFRRGLTGDEVQAEAYLTRLQCALTGAETLSTVGVALDPSGLSEAESMGLCRSLREAMARLCPGSGEQLRAEDTPDRERGYLTGRADGAGASPGEAVGCGLCEFAAESLRLLAGRRPEGLTAAIRGTGAAARAAAKRGARMGLRLAPWEVGPDVVFLCDPSSPLGIAEARALLKRGTLAVFEGVFLACTPPAAELLADSGAIFAPAVSAGAGAAVLPPGRISWEASRQLRRRMCGLIDLSLRAGNDLCRGAYAAALTAAADAMVLRGV